MSQTQTNKNPALITSSSRVNLSQEGLPGDVLSSAPPSCRGPYVTHPALGEGQFSAFAIKLMLLGSFRCQHHTQPRQRESSEHARGAGGRRGQLILRYIQTSAA